MQPNPQFEALLEENSVQDVFQDLLQNLYDGLFEYWRLAELVLGDGGVKLQKPVPENFSLEKNFFSLMFVYSFYRAGISEKRRVLYVTLNQCLRGMVTGCDNILDDEYKKTLDTNLPEKASKFRSVLDIMVSDRIVFHALRESAQRGIISKKVIPMAVDESLRCLLQSGAQEASEEDGVSEFLKPETILSTIHHYKTGVLFQSPWAVPSAVEENSSGNKFDRVKKALYDIGMGCQIMDDMVDLSLDISTKRHNYFASLIFHGDKDEKKTLIESLQSGKIDGKDSGFAKKFPISLGKAVETSSKYLKTGLGNLFTDEHKFMRDYAIGFITKQIGAEEFF